MPRLTVKQVVQRFEMEVVLGQNWLNRPIKVPDIHRPGLELAGHFDYYLSDRVQVFGRTETSFIRSLHPEVLRLRAEFIFQEDTPCICFTRDLPIPPVILEVGEAAKVPVLRTSMTSVQFISKLTDYMEEMLAPTTTIHGVLLDVYGVGVLLIGPSGIGKSETALEMVRRGHRLVADDAVEIRQTQDNRLIGNAPELIQHLLEIRGLGIINVMTLFGAGVVRTYKKISLAIRLEMWDENKQYDRLGLDEETFKIIDTEIPMITIPVRPGRDMATIVEVAAMNYRLKLMGHNAAVQFAERLNHLLEEHDLEEFEF